VRQLTSILSTQVEAPTIALRLFLLAAQIADECGFEDLTYDLYVQAFTVYEDSISESRAQLQAITLVIGTLQGAKVFGVDNYDTLITKAALHAAKLLKKPHQATGVHLASHLWWQEAAAVGEESEEEGGKDLEKSVLKEDGEGAKAVCPSSFLSYLLMLMGFFMASTHTRIASAYWNACRNLYALPIPPLRR
jgi:vacuolar protein sorting-associated protein 35